MPPPKWIVVAEDEDRVRELWCEALVRSGYRALPARNGLEALTLMGAVVPDLLILDLRMPEFSGTDLLASLPAWSELLRVPVLVISGFLGTAGEPQMPVRVNIVGRIPKPITLAGLQRAVHAVLKGPPGPNGDPG
jgi:two-component system OmpR family response regulator